MKRILMAVFAAFIAAAWAVPADAVDFSGQYRVRGEYRDNSNFDGDSGTPTSVYGQRVRLTGEAQPTDDTSVKITIQDTREWGNPKVGNNNVLNGPQLTDVGDNHLDLHESYVQIDNILDQPLSVRVGRQELVYGDQRLIGAFGWHNNARSFDAIKVSYMQDIFDLDLWTSKINEGGADDDQDFYGAYATIKAIENNTIDVYALLVRDGGSTQVVRTNHGAISPNTPQTLYTFGARLDGGMMGVDYTAEGALQTGSIETAGTDYDISASAFIVKAGYTLPVENTVSNVRIGGEYSFASGDSNTGDTDIETFSNLFPTNHGHYGFMDQQGLRNLSAFAINASADVMEKFNAYAAYWFFSLAEKEDHWYGAGNWMDAPTGSIRNAGSRSDSTHDDVGSELDLVVTYRHNQAVSLQAGYSIFFTGDLIDANVANQEDQDWAYLMLTANF